MKTYSEAEMRSLKIVYGNDITFDEEGNPIERGVGSKFQAQPFPTSTPSTGPKAEHLEFLRKMVASTGNAQLMHEFEKFLRWRDADAINRASVLEIPIEKIIYGQSNPTIPETVHKYRQMLRAGSIAPPVEVSIIGDGSSFRLQAGHHRLAAAREEGRRTIRAMIVKDPLADRNKI